MTWFCIITAIVLNATILDVGAEQSQLQHQLEVLAGKIVDSTPAPTIRAAAKEYIIGRQLAAQDQYGPAIAHYRKSAELDDKASAPWVGIAISLSALGRKNTAIAAWKEVLARDHTHGDALLIVGLDAARNGEAGKASKLLAQRWLQREDNPIEALLRDAALTTVLHTLGKEEITSLLQSSSQHVINSAVTELVNVSRSEAWLGVLQQLIDVGAESAALDLAIAGAPLVKLKELGALLTAIPVLEAAISGDGTATKQIYETVVGSRGLPLGPRWNDHVPIEDGFKDAAQTMSVLGALDGAETLYKASLAITKDDPLVTNNLAWLLLLRDGPTEEAVTLCERALELDPTAAHVLDTVGWMYTLLGKYEKGIELLTQALRTSRQLSSEMYEHLGDTYWLHGQHENATRAWRTSANILHAQETRQDAIIEYSQLIHSVWGIAVTTPEALYDSELGELSRRIILKLAAIEEGRTPLIDAAKIIGAE